MSSNAIKLKDTVITVNGMYWTGKTFSGKLEDAKKYSSYSKAQTAIAKVKAISKCGNEYRMETLPSPWDELL